MTQTPTVSKWETKWKEKNQWVSSSSFRSSVAAKKKYILGKHSRLLLWGRLDWTYEHGTGATLSIESARKDLVSLGNWVSRKMGAHLHLHAFYSPENSDFQPHSHAHIIVQSDERNYELPNLIREGWRVRKYSSDWCPNERVSKGGVWTADYEVGQIDDNLRYCLAGHDDLLLSTFCGVKTHGKRCRRD
jgi:hypothetical protein